MKNLKTMLVLVGCVAALSLSSGNLLAQGRGNFDPAAMRQRMMDRYKEVFGVTDDAEWTAISAAIGKVLDARMDIGFGGGGMFGRNRGGNTNAASTTTTTDQTGQTNSPPRRQRGGFGGTPSPEADALQKAIEAKAPAGEIKTKLAAYRKSVKAKEAKLEEAQSELRKLLTPRQEAAAVLGGLLK